MQHKIKLFLITLFLIMSSILSYSQTANFDILKVETTNKTLQNSSVVITNNQLIVSNSNPRITFKMLNGDTYNIDTNTLTNIVINGSGTYSQTGGVGYITITATGGGADFSTNNTITAGRPFTYATVPMTNRYISTDFTNDVEVYSNRLHIIFKVDSTETKTNILRFD